ncbi:hypothetical protein MAHJHV60_45640 [Mycobacterium avium subsp. hominissuis]
MTAGLPRRDQHRGQRGARPSQQGQPGSHRYSFSLGHRPSATAMAALGLWPRLKEYR